MTPRPKRFRKIGSPPVLKGFKPIGVPFFQTEVVSILFEEYETLRLSVYENYSQEESAKIMGVSRPTFNRIFNSCQKKISQAFAEGKSMIIEGGNVEFDKEWFRCNECHIIFHSSKTKKTKCISCGSVNIEHINKNLENWKNRINDIRQEDIEIKGFCICPNCKHEEPHQRGVPCFSKTCPDCKIPLIRKDL